MRNSSHCPLYCSCLMNSFFLFASYLSFKYNLRLLYLIRRSLSISNQIIKFYFKLKDDSLRFFLINISDIRRFCVIPNRSNSTQSEFYSEFSDSFVIAHHLHVWGEWLLLIVNKSHAPGTSPQPSSVTAKENSDRIHLHYLLLFRLPLFNPPTRFDFVTRMKVVDSQWK